MLSPNNNRIADLDSQFFSRREKEIRIVFRMLDHVARDDWNIPVDAKKTK